MVWPWDRREKWLAVGGAAITVAVAAGVLAFPHLFSGLNNRIFDRLTFWAGAGRPSGRVVVIEIDEKSLSQYGRWPWRRDLLALLTNRLRREGSAAIVFDAVFSGRDGGGRSGEPDPDAGFAAALSGYPTVVGYEFDFGGGPPAGDTCDPQPLRLAVIGRGQDFLFHPGGLVCNSPSLARAAGGSGFLNAAPDSDGVLRRIPLVIEFGGRFYPSLALAALNAYRGSNVLQINVTPDGAAEAGFSGNRIPLEGRGMLRLRFRGPRRTLPHVSAAAVMSGQPLGVPLGGKIAVVGGTAPGIDAPSHTPLDPLCPGVEVQANAIDNLVQGDPWSRPGSAAAWETLALLLVGLVSAGLLAFVRPAWGAAATLLLVAGVWGFSFIAISGSRSLFSPLPATLAASCNYAVLTLVNYALEKRRADRAGRKLATAVQSTVQVRTALAASQSRYERLVENINDAITETDPEGRLAFANRRFREWFGLVDRDLAGVTLEDCAAPEWRAPILDFLQRAARGEPTSEFEYEGIRPDGTRIWLEAIAAPVVSGDRITGVQTALRDVTERKRIEAQYLQAQKMESIGRLAGGVAHDFNNLLTVINGYSAMLLATFDAPERLHEGLVEIHKAGVRAADLTQKLLIFSRKQITHPQPLNLNHIVADEEKMLRRLIGEDIQLVTSLAPDLGMVYCDPGHMHQVLMNLAVNSRDSMPDGGRIVVETGNVAVDEESAAAHFDIPPGSYVHLAVTDTGIGMNKETQSRIFEPFFTTKGPAKGTGLGLATVFGIVQQAGGQIRVQSEPGRGAAFHVYIPRTAETRGAPAKPGAAPVKTQRGETVLIVEDEEAVRGLAARALEACGYRVLQAAGGVEAIGIAEEFPLPIHLLLTDVVLPAMNGREVAGALLDLRPGIKTLYMSGYPDEIIAHKGMLDDGVVCVPKPFDPDTLTAMVKEMLDGGRAGERAEPRAGNVPPAE